MFYDYSNPYIACVSYYLLSMYCYTQIVGRRRRRPFRLDLTQNAQSQFKPLVLIVIDLLPSELNSKAGGKVRSQLLEDDASLWCKSVADLPVDRDGIGVDLVAGQK